MIRAGFRCGLSEEGSQAETNGRGGVTQAGGGPGKRAEVRTHGNGSRNCEVGRTLHTAGSVNAAVSKFLIGPCSQLSEIHRTQIRCTGPHNVGET